MTIVRARRVTLGLLVGALVATACTGSEPPPAEDAAAAGSQPASATPPGSAAAAATTSGATEDEGSAADDDGAQGLTEEDLTAIAATWIAEESGLTPMLQEEISLERVERSGRAYHLQYVQAHDDVTVRGARFIVTILEDGTVQNASNSLRTVLPAEDATLEVGEAEAVDVATKAVDGSVRGDPQVLQTWVQRGDGLRLGWDVRFSTEDPLGSWSVVIDASTGAVLVVDDLASDQRPLTPADPDDDGSEGGQGSGSDAASDTGSGGGGGGGNAACDLPAADATACVYPLDPSNVAGTTDLTDEEANATLVGVELRGLDDPTSGELAGEYVAVHPQVADRYTQPDGTWGAEGRGTDDFTAAMGYYWIDAAQRQLQELGFPVHGDDPVDLSPIEDGLEFNAFYDPVLDAILFGVNPETGRDYGEDGAVVLHEYAHAIVTDAVGILVEGEGGSINEGFADVFSVLTSLPQRREPECLGSWVVGDCIRRVDGDRTYPEDLVLQPHQDGQIYSGAVWAYFTALLEREGLAVEDCADPEADPCAGPRDQALATLVASLGYLTPDAGLQDAAVAFALADEAQFGGDAADLIAGAFGSRGLPVDGSAPTTGNGGEPPTTTAGAAVAVGIDLTHPFRGDLDIDLAVASPEGEILCEAPLLDPDPQDDGDDLVGIADVSDTPCAALAPPTAQQLWVLRIVDTAAEDVGELRDFTVFVGEVPYPASGLPLPIPDDDPTGIVAIVAGADAPPAPQPTDDGDVKEAESMPTPDAPAPGGEQVTAVLDVRHPYRGDLQVRVGVAGADGAVQCAVPLLDPDPQDDGDDIVGEADVSECAALWPPAPDRVWFLEVVDTAPEDVGTIEGFALNGLASSATFSGSVDIPDADPDGAVVLHDGA